MHTWGTTIAVDFESYYCTKSGAEHSIDSLGGWAYNRHQKSWPFLVSIFDGQNLWVGDPHEFDWTTLEGRVLLSHNASHDEDVYEAGVEQGRWPRVAFAAWHCTADLSSYLTGHRNLLDASEALLGITISKQVRSNADGKTKDDLIREGSWQAMVDYAGDDAKHSWAIWDQHGARWPETERRISRLNREKGRRGVRLDVAELKRCISLLETVVAESTDRLPWVKRGKKPASTIGIAEECRNAGIPNRPVKSGPNGDLEAHDEWLDQYESAVPWVKDLKNLSSAKKMLATARTMLSRVRDDETMPFSLLYWGAGTGRFSGTGGVNFQNFNKEPLFKEWDKEKGVGVDIRGIIIPREGKRFAVCDLAQIEPRVLNWLVGNEQLLEKVRSGMSIYEAFARTSTGWTGGNLKKEDKYRYALSKAQVLALGYQAGWVRFISMALMPMYGCLDLCAEDEKVALSRSIDGKIYIDVKHTREDGSKVVISEVYSAETHGTKDATLKARYIVVNGSDGLSARETVFGANARAIVKQFRDSNPLLAGPTGIWKQLDDGGREAARTGEDFVVDLPHGGEIRYRKCRSEKRIKRDKETGEVYTKWEVRADVGKKVKSIYGGLCTENLCQRLGRDVFVDGLLRCEEHGYPFTFSVHDEGIFELDDDGTEVGRKIETPDDTVLGRCLALLAQSPAWAKGLPVAAEGVWTDRYLK